jgi:hypothetical protein
MAAKTPYRFDSSMGAESVAFKPVIVWEYVVVSLAAGETTIALTATDPEVRLDSIFITRSQTMVPSKSAIAEEGNLNHTWYRYRVTQAPDGVAATGMRSFIHYMWPHFRPPSDTKIHYSSMGVMQSVDGAIDVPVDQWTAWVQADEQTTNAGEYFSDTMTIKDAATGEVIPSGMLDVQLAWYPHEAAVLRAVQAPIFNGTMRYLVPVAPRRGYQPALNTERHPAVWGTRDPDYVARLRTERQFLEALFTTLEIDKLKPGTMPKRLRIFTIMRVAPDSWDIVMDLLKKAGINSVPGLDYDFKSRYDLPLETHFYEQSGTIAVHGHDPMDPTYETGLLQDRYGLAALAPYIAADPDFLTRPHWRTSMSWSTVTRVSII